jgi:hypothetical protein
MIVWPRLTCLALLVLPGIGAAPGAQARPFEFYSDFWLNLHHFLYEQALHQGKPREDLAKAETIASDKAVEFYRRSMIAHDLLFDPHMQSIDTELAEDESLPTHGMLPTDSLRLASQISAAAKSNGVQTPKDLVHIFIFYTAGELTRRDLAATGVNNYVPFADEKKLYQQDWASWHSSIEVYRKQHIDGNLSLNDGVNKTISDARRKDAK